MTTETQTPRIIDAKEIRDKIKEKFSTPFAPSPMSPTNYVKNVGERFIQENIINMWKGSPTVPNLLKSYEQSNTLGNHIFSYYYVVYELTSESSYKPVEYVLDDFTTIPWYYAK